MDKDVKKLQPILEWLVASCRVLLKEVRILSECLEEVTHTQVELGLKPTYENLNKKINGIREELDGLRIHYQSTLKEIEELRKPKRKQVNIKELSNIYTKDNI